MASKTYTDYLEEILKSQKLLKEEKLADVEKEYDSLLNQAKEQYLNDINNAENSYDDYINKSYVQKLIDKKQVEETMANIGLSDSGLNRTQQTAVEISHSNRVGNYNSLKQQKIDSLAQAMRSKMLDIETEKVTAKNKIKDQFDEEAHTKATELFNNATKGENTQAKDWDNVTNVLFDDKASSKERSFVLEQYFLKYGFTDNEKLLLDKMNIDYRSYGKSKNEQVASGEKTEYIITDSRKQQLKNMCSKEFISRKDLANERNINNIKMTYDKYRLQVLQNWRLQKRINEAEYEYLLEELGLKK
ncbi:MAG: hypothetical protein E7365_07520 [Clostridiales bacterium]|nr:hypothetical protein [Clostridiales bacterium]